MDGGLGPPNRSAPARASRRGASIRLGGGITPRESEPAEIRYLLFVNNDPNPTEVVMGITRTVAYGSTTGPNTFVLKAVDAAGNASLSNPVTLDLFC